MKFSLHPRCHTPSTHEDVRRLREGMSSGCVVLLLGSACVADVSQSTPEVLHASSGPLDRAVRYPQWGQHGSLSLGCLSAP
jgi:hypothetical protein